MIGTELFEATLMLWGAVALLFVAAGFVTGEWQAAYRELRERLSERDDHHRPDAGTTAARAG